MLSKINRLRKEKDFETLFKKGKSFRNGFLILKIVQNNLEESRFGFIVSQKVSKKAALRNKIKRRIRAVARQNIKKIRKGIDVALIALPGLEKKNFLETKEILNALLKNITTNLNV
ncbi:MAG: ribonuclease P protein component [Patescibacteria group bacterium]